MAVDVAATTSAEAAQYRAAGWWSDITLSDCVRRNAVSTPDKAAYVDYPPGAPDRAMTWSEFDNAATNLAARLHRLGVTPGDRVAFWHSDSTPIHVLLVAIERCGAVGVGLGARAGVREAAQILRTARPALLVSDTSRGAQATRAAADADPSLRAVVLGAEGLTLDTTPGSMVGLSPLGPDEAWLINSTSGTTGLPKCVVHNQNRWHYFHQKAVANGELSADDVFLPVIPTPFGFGIWTSHTTPIYLGATTVRIERFDPVATCAAIERHRVTVLCCVSTQLMMIVANAASREYDLSSLRIVFTGGEPLPYTQAAQFEELTGVTILQFYGSNETGMLSATTVKDSLHHRLRTAGRVVPEMQVRLFDGDTDVTETGRGQPVCRGPATSLGYLGGTDHDTLFTRDGWMRMGDICDLDRDGYLVLAGRTSDFILRGGKNISAVAVEEVVDTHPAVAVAAAVAMPDPLFGERVCVFAELKHTGDTLELPALVDHLLAQGVSKELLPERLEVLDELPRSSGGKIAKGELREKIRSILERS
ncbi:class I adenylate-forming enzyme family protein [Mycobacterium sp. CVI_P3]|uniref:Class I adenylate-forming enzyme family protein n=1 Tax=Mycobacterium pinniadriaticum TaxID=2994102 RepID=A0ABT3SAF6_9MYCO|nr:class I adenylate-forming enzyme family protein [Mycobacterium pinniadriaticum]MCX2929854.1 class I adenylate-forming enzyme family protein [Mycobacterium pinniadriaticum]MCX2936497.1 class I adenylate-forming enzyme family protein [Mycobacterium pinniadriaticum]